ncbi:ABC transporter permease [Roseibacterium sp. SDUM158017]|uniref:FtsX-like permease family protein n=1 Tax=Roseicyclus salinarum TaxID=3036773 RepID=UPI002415674F|nr:ABC transporter permease [Roseibacterium sp. SDUM158017]MDG4647002.1 ABC transporter permease [Roseibacterium sp. SDUM158017]
MLYTALSTLFSHWRRNPLQLAMLWLGLALATALWSAVQAINAEARTSYDQAASTLGQDRLARLVASDGGPVPRADYTTLRRAGYRVSPVITGELRDEAGRLRLIGIDPFTAPAETGAPGIGGEADLRAFLTHPGLLLVSRDTAEGPLPANLPPLQVDGTVPPAAALTDIATAARLLGQSDPSYLLVAPVQPPGLPPIGTASGLRAVPPDEAGDVARLTESFHLNLTAFGLLAFAVGLFIVHAAIGLAFEQRRQAFRTLRALGLPLGTLITALAVEVAIMALIAGAIGITLGYAVAAALMPGVAGTLRGLYGASVPGGLTFDPVWAASAMGITLIGAGVAAAQAMIRTARMPLLAPAQPRAWAQASGRAMRRQAVAAVGLAGVAVLTAWLGDGLIAGFAVLAALLMGAALALPVVLAVALGVLSRAARGPFAEWVFADARQQLPALSLSLMALLLALAANIGVSSMVGSFRATFIGWLDQRLAAELYVSTADEAEAMRLQAFLVGRAEAVLPIVSAEARILDLPVDVYGVVDDATYRDAWPLLSARDGAWDALFAGEAALANEQLARRQDLSLGDTLEVGPGVTLPLAGVYSDYGNPTGQVIVAHALFREMFPDARADDFAIRVAPQDAPALAAALREEFGLPDTAVRNQAQIKRFSLDVFENTFRVTGALNVLTLGVASLALLTSLLTLASLRLPQVAPVWAIGVARGRLARAEVWRLLLLAALTFVLALPVGLALAWVLLAVVNVEAFGWRLPMRVFPADWIRLLVLALVAAGVAASYPALRLSRMAPVRLLQVFSQER